MLIHIAGDFNAKVGKKEAIEPTLVNTAIIPVQTTTVSHSMNII